MRSYLFILIALILVSCQCKNQNTQCTRYYDDGRAKPIVTIVPMLDSTCYEIPWSLSEELTSLVENKIVKQGNIYLSSEKEYHLSSEDNPFGSNLNWIKNSFKSSEFIVFLELIEHDDISIMKTAKDPSKIPESRRAATNLNIAARLRVIDVRKDSPKIVLQELIKDVYYMPNNIDNPDYNTCSFGTEEYKTSPLGIAHTQFTKQIIERINDYLMLAKSK